MELIKPIIKVGNSAGVLLPREWLNGEARVVLLRKPQNIRKDIFDILEQDLQSIIGLYIVGSYARDEQTKNSDIDILGVTNGIDKKIKKGKYEIILVSLATLEESLEKNVIPLLPMILEAKPLLNSGLLEKYKKTRLTKRNLDMHFQTTSSALKVVNESLSLAKESGKMVSDNIAYSLVLRLRELYIVDCLIKEGKATTLGLTRLIKKISGSNKAHLAYQRSKSGLKVEYALSVGEAESIYHYLLEEIEVQKRWIKQKG